MYSGTSITKLDYSVSMAQMIVMEQIHDPVTSCCLTVLTVLRLAILIFPRFNFFKLSFFM
jgi:hypothetical protein